MPEYNREYNDLRVYFEEELEKFVENLKVKPEILKESMKYSLLAGGKRLRPVMLLKTALLLGVDKSVSLPFAIALECIHTYSLIHDDLPAMDNDDFRRGKPTNHKVYGEDNAVLAGDGLLNLAFEICLDECVKTKEAVNATKYLVECSGSKGMIAGQSADLFSTKKREYDMNELEFIQSNKTSKLIMAGLGVASYLSGGKCLDELEAFGYNLGMLFQITDDILDVEGNFEILGKSIGKDADENKLTSVKLLGLNGAKKLADEYESKCNKLLSQMDFDTTFFNILVENVRSRKA